MTHPRGLEKGEQKDQIVRSSCGLRLKFGEGVGGGIGSLESPCSDEGLKIPPSNDAPGLRWEMDQMSG